MQAMSIVLPGAQLTIIPSSINDLSVNPYSYATQS